MRRMGGTYCPFRTPHLGVRRRPLKKPGEGGHSRELHQIIIRGAVLAGFGRVRGLSPLSHGNRGGRSPPCRLDQRRPREGVGPPPPGGGPPRRVRRAREPSLLPG